MRPWVIELGASVGLQADTEDDADVLFGGTLFAAYRPSERWHLGARGVGGGTPHGGYAGGGGPALSVRVVGPLWTGVWVGAGASGMQAPGFEFAAYDSTEFGPAAGIELGLAMTQSTSGAFFLQMVPSVFIGDGDGAQLMIPIGLSYRFW
jgi:hypothetical protein